MSTELTLPAGYGDVLAELKSRVRQAQTRARRAVNTELLVLYWHIGAVIRDRQGAEGWGASTVERLAAGEAPHVSLDGAPLEPRGWDPYRAG